MTKHTPAPWKFKDTGASAKIISADGGTIATIIVTSKGTPEEKKANARLIAAAPELLEAAQKALDDCVDLIGTEAGYALEAAIAKATGK